MFSREAYRCGCYGQLWPAMASYGQLWPAMVNWQLQESEILESHHDATLESAALEPQKFIEGSPLQILICLNVTCCLDFNHLQPLLPRWYGSCMV